MNTALVDIGTAGIAISDALYESIGELTPEIQASIDALLAQGEDALDGAAWVVRKLEADAKTLKFEAERYTARAESLEKNAAALKARMLFAVDAAFNGKIKTAKNTIWGQNAAPSLTIELAADADLAKLDITDSEFVRKTYALDKVAVRRRFDAGDPIPSAINVTENLPTRFLRIK